MMKKLLMAATAATALTATPAMADDSIAITATASVAPTCKLGANVLTTAGAAGSSTPIGFDPTGAADLINTANSAVNLGLATPQRLATLIAVGNTVCNATVNTQNNFRLQNLADPTTPVPFSLILTAPAGAVTGSANGSVSAGLKTQPGEGTVTATLDLRFPVAANTLNLAPGAYADVITVTVMPEA